MTDEQLATAIIDRIVHYGHLIDTGSKDWRLEHSLMKDQVVQITRQKETIKMWESRLCFGCYQNREFPLPFCPFLLDQTHIRIILRHFNGLVVFIVILVVLLLRMDKRCCCCG
jgi:hypothetical protein